MVKIYNYFDLYLEKFKEDSFGKEVVQSNKYQRIGGTHSSLKRFGG